MYAVVRQVADIHSMSVIIVLSFSLSSDDCQTAFPLDCRNEQVVLFEELDAKKAIQRNPLPNHFDKRMEMVMLQMPVKAEPAWEIECRLVVRCLG